jgi:hypothetical protein
VKRTSNKLRATSEDPLLVQERENGPLQAGSLHRNSTQHKMASRPNRLVCAFLRQPKCVVAFLFRPIKALLLVGERLLFQAALKPRHEQPATVVKGPGLQPWRWLIPFATPSDQYR